MVNYRIVHRSCGIADVYEWHTDPPVKLGVVVRLVSRRSTPDWIFFPVRWFARMFPVAGFVKSRRRKDAVSCYLQESRMQRITALVDAEEVRI